MLTSTPLTAQLDAARGDPLSVLIVGAGVAGVTLAQLLLRQGVHPVLVEREAAGGETGYMLALLPLVDPVLDRLEVWDGYRRASQALNEYRLRDSRGRVLRAYPIGELLNRYVEYRGLDRGSLLEVIASGGGAVSYGTTVTGIEQADHAVRAQLRSPDGDLSAKFDLVVGADGLHSAIRGLVLAPGEVSAYDSGWGGWIAWAAPDEDQHVAEEMWGAGFFVGSYPVKSGQGVFVGGARVDTDAGPARFVSAIRRKVRTPEDSRLSRSLAAVQGASHAYFWRLADYRADRWAVGRVVLLGDAAAGFLPTAGIGAGMAMESAWILAEHLRGASRSDLPTVIANYERAQRPRVDAAQGNSRQLARIMFHRSRLVAAARDVAARFMTLDMALGPIRRLLESQPGAPDSAG